MKLVEILLIIIIILLSIILMNIVYNRIEEYNEQELTDPILDVLKTLLIPVDPIFENIKLNKGNKSYTLNKEDIYICVKDEKGEYYPMNSLVHVILHEVAHMLNTKDVGHTKEWQNIFNDLLKKAEEKKVYNPNIPMVSNYCGVK
jgi:hypothetical protein